MGGKNRKWSRNDFLKKEFCARERKGKRGTGYFTKKGEFWEGGERRQAVFIKPISSDHGVVI